MNKKIKDYKTFEELKFKNSKDMYNWSAITPKHYGVEIEATNLLVKKLSGKTPHLDWVHSEGFSVRVHKFDDNKRGNSKFLEHLGQKGVPYRFYLIPSWNKENFLEHLENDGMDEEEVSKTFSLLGIDDIDDLEIYGKSVETHYKIKIDNEEIDLNYILDLYEDNIDEWGNFKIEVSIESLGDLDMMDECPFWGAKAPLRFNNIPGEGSNEYNVLCEYGLMMVRFEIGKLIQSGGYDSYYKLASGGMSDDIIDRDTDMLIKYMNLSKVHISKNEDLRIAVEVSYNIYKGTKLFDENHKDRRYKIDMDLVSRFLKEV